MFWKSKKGDSGGPYIDSELYEYIQMQGGITFSDPGYILSGDGYTKVIHIYQLPPTLTDYWMGRLCNIDETIATVDIGTRDSVEVKKNINKALKEELSRAAHATDFMELYNAKKRQEQLQSMYDEIQSMGEVVKTVHFRIYVSGRSLYELEARAEKIMASLESDQYMNTVLLNEGKRQWQSLFRGYEQQQKEVFAIKAHPLMTEQLAGGNPFHYSDLDDEYGDLLGFTPCGGPVIYDEFTKTEKRKHYNSLVVGDMGSGKSTLLKKRFRSRAERGDFIRCFDISGEFSAITKEFGGKIIRCDGNEGILNPLEILKAGDDEFTSFARHISKVSTFYSCFVPSASDIDIIKLQNLLREFYEERELTPKGGRAITGRPAKAYPVLSDFLLFIETKMQQLMKKKVEGAEAALIEKDLLAISVIEQSLRSMVDNYGQIFDGVTSIDNIVDRQIVTFDISTIKDLGNVFVAQLFNMVSLCWDNCVANGQLMKEQFEDGEIRFSDVVRFLIIVDESHRWVNTKMPMILDLVILYLREARKYFAGILLASQSVRDYMPEGSGSENMDKIKTVFELTQYKFMFRQDSAALPLIDSIFNNVLTISQRQQIPTLGVGQTILSIASDRNLEFKVWMSKEYEEPLFKGGA